MTNSTEYIVRNSITKGYWDGASFSATCETARPVNAGELATLRATYQNCEFEAKREQEEAAASDQRAIQEAARLAFIHMPDKIGELLGISQQDVQRLKDTCLFELLG